MNSEWGNVKWLRWRICFDIIQVCDQNKPQCILNVDETGISPDHNSTNVQIKIGYYLHFVTSRKYARTTGIASVNAPCWNLPAVSHIQRWKDVKGNLIWSCSWYRKGVRSFKYVPWFLHQSFCWPCNSKALFTSSRRPLFICYFKYHWNCKGWGAGGEVIVGVTAVSTNSCMPTRIMICWLKILHRSFGSFSKSFDK